MSLPREVQQKVIESIEGSPSPFSLLPSSLLPFSFSFSLPPPFLFSLLFLSRILKLVPGLEHAKITQYGYAVEYDFVDPRQLNPTLETKNLPGLFLAGQINGITEYKEDGAKGIIAGKF